VLLVAVLFLSNLAVGAERQAFVQVLASSGAERRHRHVGGERADRHARLLRRVVGSQVQVHGGKQEGVDVIVVDNGKLQVAVCPTRGMGILWATLGDVRLGWDSPVKETVDPRFVNLQERGGLGG